MDVIKPIFVLSSHGHHDHYNPGIFSALETEGMQTVYAFLIEEPHNMIYHAGDLNDWVWEEESDFYNEQMTRDYRKQIDLLSEKLNGRKLDVAFVVLDPRQEKDYDRGLCYFLERIPTEKVYPMHYWETPDIIETFLKEHPEYKIQIRKTR